MMGPDFDAVSRLADLLGLLHEDLDHLSYYNLLGVSPGADDETIRQAFQGRSLWLHPDRHRQSAGLELRVQIEAVYRRIAEAYRVLGRPAERAAYDALLAQGVTRYSAEAAESQAGTGQGAVASAKTGTSPPPSRPDERIQSVQARQLYDLSKASVRAMDFSRAVMLLEQALAVEPKSHKISQALDEARRLKKMYGG